MSARLTFVIAVSAQSQSREKAELLPIMFVHHLHYKHIRFGLIFVCLPLACCDVRSGLEQGTAPLVGETHALLDLWTHVRAPHHAGGLPRNHPQSLPRHSPERASASGVLPLINLDDHPAGR